MATFQSTLDEDDEDLPPELVPPLIIYVKIGSCSVDPFTLVAAQIRSGPLFLSEDMRDESEAIGKADLPTSLLSFDATVELINGVVDFLLASVPPKYSRFVLQNPVGALANRSARRRPLTPAIFEAKKDNLPAALPQAAMAVASYRKQHEFDYLPPVASRQANSWAFFFYKGREICIADQISLGANLENLSLVLGLLKDLAENALVQDSKYFSY
ncbi:hypothetical protein AX14_012170 [Amanita brunnescens Koide BX004]|nr:hypothetical protein AX14_012170 [Amanita brunnescens Koide BX004]